MYKRYIKNILGCTLSSFGLVLCFIPMLIIALAIRIDSKGPFFLNRNGLARNRRFSRCISSAPCATMLLKKAGWLHRRATTV